MSSSRRSSISVVNPETTLLDEIDQWERGTLLLVKQTAERARQRVHELMLLNREDKSDSHRRRSLDNSMDQLNFKLRNLQTTLNTNSSRIRINISPIDWSSILRVYTETSSLLTSNFFPKRDLFVGGTLLTEQDQSELNQFFETNNQKWILTYKATKDGFSMDDFHRCADRQGPTVTIIQSLDNYLFGAFTSVSWNFHQGAKSAVNDKTAFLFTLSNPHGIPPTKYPIKSSGQNALVPNSMGPTFGQSDICIYPNSNLHSQSFIKFPNDYQDLTGKGYLTFTGSTHFTTTDIEIYRPANIYDQQF